MACSYIRNTGVATRGKLSSYLVGADWQRFLGTRPLRTPLSGATHTLLALPFTSAPLQIGP